jgi:hypothetical protein
MTEATTNVSEGTTNSTYGGCGLFTGVEYGFKEVTHWI